VNIVGSAYEFGPSGVTFSIKVTININYNPEDIPEGVSETNLVIGYYDEKAQAWIPLDSIIDTIKHSIEAQTDHFSLYAILSGPIIPPTTPAPTQTPTPTPAGLEPDTPLPEQAIPATFVLSEFKISPVSIYAGESINISAVVGNVGDTADTYRVVVTIDNMEIAAKDIYLQGGMSEIVTFDIVQNSVGRYVIEVNGTQGEIEVKAMPVEAEHSKTVWLYIIVGVVTFLLSFSTTVLIARRVYR
jgi:hypothetical protein